MFERYDKPDWYMALSTAYMNTLERIQSLSALLPINLLQSCRGKVLFFHDFNSGWSFTGSAASNAACYGAVVTDKSIFPFPVAMFQAALVLNDLYQASVQAPVYHSGKIAIEFIFQIDDVDANVRFQLYSDTPPNGYSSDVTFECDTGNVWLGTGVGGGSLAVSGNADIQVTDKWNWIKVVSDHTTHYYDTLFINTDEYDISAIALLERGVISADTFFHTLMLIRQAAGTSRIYVPYILISQEEE